MALHYEEDAYKDDKQLLMLYWEDYTALLTDVPVLKALSFDAYVNFKVNQAGISTNDDLLLDIHTRLGNKR